MTPKIDTAISKGGFVYFKQISLLLSVALCFATPIHAAQPFVTEAINEDADFTYGLALTHDFCRFGIGAETGGTQGAVNWWQIFHI